MKLRSHPANRRDPHVIVFKLRTRRRPEGRDGRWLGTETLFDLPPEPVGQRGKPRDDDPKGVVSNPEGSAVAFPIRRSVQRPGRYAETASASEQGHNPRSIPPVPGACASGRSAVTPNRRGRLQGLAPQVSP